MDDHPKNVLVVGPSWVGDMVMSQTLYIYLKQSRPGVAIDVLAPPWSEPLVARMPQVRRSIALPLNHGDLSIGARLRMGRKLRSGHYDQAILLPNSFKSALIPFFARISRRTGWRGELRYGLLNDMRQLDEKRYPKMIQRFVALALDGNDSLPEELPSPRLAIDKNKAEFSRDRFGLASHKPILALCPGAEFGSAKRWPPRYFAEIARRYLDFDWQVVLFGSAGDQAQTREIKVLCGESSMCFDLAGRTDIAEVVDLLSLSAAVVSNDSGLMHIAAALQLPVLVVYGPTSPGFTPPLSRIADTLVPEVDCAPCFQRQCPLGHHRCMLDTRPQSVADRLEALLARSKQ